jgi:hypothetical protein
LYRELNRIWLALAALRLTDEELQLFLDDCQLLTVPSARSRILRIIDQVYVPDFSSSVPKPVTKVRESRKEPVVAPSRNKIARRIEQLLRREGDLSVNEACNLLRGAFPEIHSKVPSAPGKTGFLKWLEKLLEFVPDETVLQFIEVYLGSRRSGVETDWSLGSR